MTRPDWTPHRRDDGELLGWIHPVGDDWVAVDVLGRPASVPTDWLDAEAALDERGIAWLADPWMLDGEAARPLRVRIVEVTPDRDGVPGRIVVKVDDFGDVTRPPTERFELPWPIPNRLRPPRTDDPDPRAL
ncbi:hypothetical protein [Microbacterium sp. NPDC090003]|uniref:hypothetical protein n=1 Tax=Microbacterium sp. NPDC090003 TaxID=3364203 RepID=UPI00382CE346